MALDILCLGEPMVEFNQTGGPDSRQYLCGFGGDTSNTAIAAARQDAKTGYVTQLGRDPFGDQLFDLWRAEGVDASGVRRHSSAPTGIYFVTHTPAGHAFSYYRKDSAASLMVPTDLPRALIEAAGILHVSAINLAIGPAMRASTHEAIAVAKAAGRRISFDTNLRLKLWPLEEARPQIDQVARQADILLPSLEDARALLGLEEPEAVLAYYAGLGIPLVVLKCGADGVRMQAGGQRWRLRGHRIASVDATGAGDCFDGAFLAEIIRGTRPEQAAAYANMAAAITTTGFGAVAPIPRRSAVEEALGQQASAAPEAY